MDAVSETMKLDWFRVFEMSAMEFFSIVQYINYKRKKEEEALEKFRRQNKIQTKKIR